MGEVREVFDVNQHPRKYGEITDLERRITAIKKDLRKYTMVSLLMIMASIPGALKRLMVLGLL